MIKNEMVYDLLVSLWPINNSFPESGPNGEKFDEAILNGEDFQSLSERVAFLSRSEESGCLLGCYRFPTSAGVVRKWWYVKAVREKLVVTLFKSLMDCFAAAVVLKRKVDVWYGFYSLRAMILDLQGHSVEALQSYAVAIDYNSRGRFDGKIYEFYLELLLKVEDEDGFTAVLDEMLDRVNCPFYLESMRKTIVRLMPRMSENLKNYCVADSLPRLEDVMLYLISD